jgi:hypothetical protein
MPVDKTLLDLMACPHCRAELRAEMSGTPPAEWIVCTRAECALAFPVKDGIPVMLIEEARRACPSCGTARDWDPKKDVVRCPKCGAEHAAARG